MIESGKVQIASRYNYYEKYASGKLVQWGLANYSYTDGFGRITYPIPFAGSTNDYMLFVQGQYMSGKVVEIMVASKTQLVKGMRTHDIQITANQIHIILTGTQLGVGNKRYNTISNVRQRKHV